ncbi:MAG: sugar ABC transporter substrate-binding protein [Treponema sp.]|nr:sugar ABC transporter substrate-binding protein [Treponema sp.]
MKRFLSCVLVCLVFLIGAGMVFAKGSQGGGAAASSGGTRNIVFWDMMWGPAATYTGASQALVDKFNAENTDNIRVKLQVIPWDNYYQVFLTAVTSGSAPDVATGAFAQPTQYADMGEGLPLDPVIDMWKKENNPILKDIPENIWNLHMYDGKHYGLPWNMDTRQILYRTDYFKQAGITKLPTTWAEFEDACAKLKRTLPADTYPLVFPGGGDYNALHAVLTLLVSNDAGVADKNGQPDFLNPRVTEMMEFANRLYTKGYVPEGIAAYKGVDAEKLFQAGKAAMFMHNAMALGDFPDLDKNCGVLPPMAGPSAKSAKNYSWVNPIQAFNQTKDPQACYIFIKWWLENLLPLYTQGGVTALPARSSFRQNSFFQTNWQKKQISDLVLPGIVAPIYPADNIYVPWAIIEGENIPMMGLVRSLAPNPNIRAIQQDIQNQMIEAWKEFK